MELKQVLKASQDKLDKKFGDEPTENLRHRFYSDSMSVINNAYEYCEHGFPMQEFIESCYITQLMIKWYEPDGCKYVRLLAEYGYALFYEDNIEKALDTLYKWSKH